jgi:hypothetical protein
MPARQQESIGGNHAILRVRTVRLACDRRGARPAR